MAALACGAHASLAAEFERTVSVARGTRLDVRLYGGVVTVRAWNRDAVRVRATHFATDAIVLERGDRHVSLRARARIGPSHAVDFEIDVPAWMAIEMAGTYLDIAVSGTRADVVAETVRGDVKVTGGSGTLRLRSVEGDVVLEDARGRAELSSANNAVRVTRFDGEVLAETVGGAVVLREVTGPRVEVSTVGGDIDWDGTVRAGGRYQFATHDGDLDIVVAEQASVALGVRSFHGHLRATFPMEFPDQPARRKGFRRVFGAGAAQVDLETFRGTISLRRPE